MQFRVCSNTFGARKLIETKNESKTGRTIAIGDIHGHADALKRLLDEIQPCISDTIIPLGDYVNRGPDSCGVIETLIKLSEHCRVYPILGNHDEMMLEARNNRDALDRFRHDGGDHTCGSYSSVAWFYAESLRFVPDEHWEFLNRCLPFYENDDCIFTHASYDPFLAMKDQSARLLRWTSIATGAPVPHFSGKIVVVGHTPELFLRHYGHLVCIDTACGFGGKLTAHEQATGMTWWVGETGIQRQGAQV